ncbi:MAG: hypothetical protein WC998_08625 [Candidatus Paceibacterota bacterium]|jgi:hypothetical protein
MALTVTQRRVREGVTAIYTATVQDEHANALEPADLTTLTLTLYDKTTGTIINSRDGQSILNTNNVTIASGGLLTWTMQPADNAIVTTASFASGQYEKHIALFEWTWNSGAKAGKYEVQIDVEQMTKVP